MSLSPASRSAVGNGSRHFVENLDGRSASARRYRDLLAGFVRDLGGDDSVTQTQRELARRAAALALSCETQERKLVAGEEVDAAQLATSGNALQRVLRELGLLKARRSSARTKPAGGSITGYLERTA